MDRRGKPQACGRIVDKYGVRRQIVPTLLLEMMSHPDKSKAGRTTAEMLRQVRNAFSRTIRPEPPHDWSNVQ